MNFATDRDLLAIEPSVFNDVPFVAQQRIAVSDATVTGTTLTSSSADFTAAAVDAGSVVLVSQTPHEVISRTDQNTIVISLPRASSLDAAIPSGDGTALSVEARTFELQTSSVHDALLRLAGIELDNPDNDLSETSVISASAMVKLECLGALERIYQGAIALVGDNDLLRLKADEYRRRFREACAATTLLIDSDGDGIPDEKRSLGVIGLTRV